MVVALIGLISIIFLWREHSKWEKKRDTAQPLSSWDKMNDDEKLQWITNNIKFTEKESK